MDHDFLLLFGSQTGQAESIAQELEKDAEAKGFKCQLYCMDQFKRFDLQKEKVVVIVSSTTGEGDPPDNAARLWRRLKKKALPSDHLKNLKYTVLGLGDTNYTNFCQMGKNFDSRLADLGAERFYPAGFADDGTGLEVVVEPWRAGLWNALAQAVGKAAASEGDEESSAATGKGTDVDTQTAGLPEGISRGMLRLPRLHDPQFDVQVGEEVMVNGVPTAVAEDSRERMAGRLVGYRCLTARDAVKRALEVAIELPEGHTYITGDAFGVSCPNVEAEVEELVQRQGLQDAADKPISICPAVKETSRKKPTFPSHLWGACTLRHALRSAVSLRSVPKKAALRLLAQHATDPADENALLFLCSSQGAKTYGKEIRDACASVTDVLKKYPSCRPPLNVLLDVHMPLQPRYYSACTAPGKTVHFTFNVVDNAFPEACAKKGPGLCTSFLEHQCLRVFAAATGKSVSSVTHLRELEERNVWYRVPSSKDSHNTHSSSSSSGGNGDYGVVETITDAVAAVRVEDTDASPSNSESSASSGDGDEDGGEGDMSTDAGTWMQQCMDAHAHAVSGSASPAASLSSSSSSSSSSSEATAAPPVFLFRRPPLGFSLVDNPTTPIVMIGPGTGVAPFLGFLQCRQRQENAGPALLFVGCRHRDKDLLFESEWRDLEKSGALTRVFVASSRDGGEHKYVQDCLQAQAPLFYETMVQKKGVLYVCGNALTMGRQLDMVVDSILKQEGQLSSEEVKKVRDEWKEEQRFRRELWA